MEQLSASTHNNGRQRWPGEHLTQLRPAQNSDLRIEFQLNS